MQQDGGRVPDDVFDALVDAEIDGRADEETVTVLFAEARRWREALLDRLDDADDAVERAKGIPGPERAQVVADLESICDEIEDALDRLDRREGHEAPKSHEAVVAGVPVAARLQASWSPGHIVVWFGGPDDVLTDVSELRGVFAGFGPTLDAWKDRDPVLLPDKRRAAALSAPIAEVLGWLVGCASDDRVGASTRWLGQLGLLAVGLVARGSIVPLLRHRHRTEGTGTFAVRWHPVLVDEAMLQVFADAAPAAVLVADPKMDALSVTRSALVGAVDAICVQAARLVETSAPPPRPSSAADLAEAYLGRLDGSAFRAPVDSGRDLVRFLDDWARPVTKPLPRPLVVRLHPPDEARAWYVEVLGHDPDGVLLPIERAMASHPNAKIRARLVEDLMRAERLLPELGRAGAQQRGEAILTEDEAWELMSVTGGDLVSAGFMVEVPKAGRAPRPSLRLTALDSTPATSAAELAHVRWSVLFDDVELSAADIADLANRAAPLVKSHGRWVRLDDADLAAAAEALRGRSEEMTGGEMLRWAVGLHGSPFESGVSIANGWAAELVGAARTMSGEPAHEPDGFAAQLRSYQRDALAWLQFCDAVGLGGCLALDMGLGKTPTVLAHVLATAGDGPTLVIAPSAVVGNWRSEAMKFTPGLRVSVHHGATRATPDEIAAEVAGVDLVVTTYGTAVRDLDALAEVQWHRVVLDEAQAIKNPASEVARGLRRLPSQYRLAMTGTPIENGLGDLWAILDFVNPGLVGDRADFVSNLSRAGSGEAALRALNGILVFRRTKAEPEIADELPERIDETDHCTMTAEQIGLYQAVLDKLVLESGSEVAGEKGRVLVAITQLKQICNHPAAFTGDTQPLDGRSGKLARLDDIIETVFAVGERIIVFTQYATWATRLAEHLTERTGTPVAAYHGGLPRTTRDRIIDQFQASDGPAALVLSLKAGGAGLNLTAANHVVLFDRWWNPAVEDQARDRAWRLGQQRTVIFHRLECPGTIDDRVEEIVAGKRHVANLVLPTSSSLEDLDAEQLRRALGLREDEVLTDDAPLETATDENAEVTA
jgi:superfamily II DNA or RNA helicase